MESINHKRGNDNIDGEKVERTADFAVHRRCEKVRISHGE